MQARGPVLAFISGPLLKKDMVISQLQSLIREVKYLFDNMHENPWVEFPSQGSVARSQEQVRDAENASENSKKRNEESSTWIPISRIWGSSANVDTAMIQGW